MTNLFKNLIAASFIILISACSHTPFGDRSPSSEDLKTVVVTGGASGLGLEVVKKYNDAGFRVVIAARRPPVEPEVLNFPNVSYIATDLEKPDDLKHLVDEVMSKYGSLDYLIHNAAMVSLEDGLTIDSKILTRSIQTNYIAPAELTAYALHAMEEVNKPIRVIYVSSAAAIMPKEEFSRYGASKAASEMHFTTLSQELDTMKSTGKLSANHQVAIIRPAMIRGNYTPGATGSTASLTTAEALRNISPTTAKDVAKKIFSVSQEKNMPVLKNVGIDGVLMELGHRMFPPALMSKIQNVAIALITKNPLNSDESCIKQLSHFIQSSKKPTLAVSGAALLAFMLTSDSPHPSK